MISFLNRAVAAVCTATLLATPVWAETVQGPHVALELNALEPVDGACRISFVVQNGHEADIAQAVYEAVLFDTQGRVNRMTLFDFGELPAARPRVRQFVLAGLACADLGRLLINGAETCEGTGLPGGACTDGLDLRSRTDVEVLG
ncbi:hypothetical protein KUW09_05120 [Mameliella alba]|nr:hypothetical protein [Antarctobacter heliothermus]MBY6143410.1 hypothetical protein [Mameliella alba]MBY6162492.1 hypothetical protein [Mameliella alba]MBY6171851.1 hypothetical protein [Mameliella alba]MBY6175979.1 hypothetical protein [Mameliella alba]